MTRAALAVALLAPLAFTPDTADAQQRICAQRDQIVEQLDTRHNEDRVALGLQPDSNVLEVFASDESGTWTIIVTAPNGVSCLVAVGEAWQGDLKEVSSLLGDPA